jgi:hypothetical protein
LLACFLLASGGAFIVLPGIASADTDAHDAPVAVLDAAIKRVNVASGHRFIDGHGRPHRSTPRAARWCGPVHGSPSAARRWLTVVVSLRRR